MENINFRTDMADERVDEYKTVNNLTTIDGIKVTSENKEKIKKTIVQVLDENGKNAVGKDIGMYITMEIESIEYLTEDEKEEIIKEVSESIKSLFDKKIKSIMVVGLGNEKVTPDALGPKVISYINVTRHMIKYAREYVKPDTREISALSPGVLGTTGIETEEIIESVTKFVKPDLLIVIDSLASMSINRVGRTIQFGNTGITPGAGVGNTRHAINKENLGIDVIAIGVPTVVDIATITTDCLNLIANKTKDTTLNNILINTTRDKVAQTLHTENYIVTPKEIDEVILKISEIIASALNAAL